MPPTSAFPTLRPALSTPTLVLAALLGLFASLTVAASPTHAAQACTTGNDHLCLDGRFRLEVAWTDPRSHTSGTGKAVPLTSDTGAFWFFDEANLELAVKVLDGGRVNGHFWVFYASLSDVEYTLTVTDTADGGTRSYHNPAFSMASRGDTEAFLKRPETEDELRLAHERVKREAAEMTAEDFAARYRPAPVLDRLSYDPLQADFLPAIEQAFTLGEAHRSRLADNGFVIFDGPPVGTFEDLYSLIYDADLPVLVTADSLLYALHRSYDSLLQELELEVLAGEVGAFLDRMHEQLRKDLGSGALDGVAAAARDVDVYLAVARSLLADQTRGAVSGPAANEKVTQILRDAAALQPKELTLFGRAATYDYSQLRPRGHYEGVPVLESYFRALMWIGRTELPLVSFEGNDPSRPRLNRIALEAAYLLNSLLDRSGGRSHWNRVNMVLERMVGEKDSMDPADLDRFQATSGYGDLNAVAATPDDALLSALLDGSYGVQRIMSQVMYSDPLGPQIQLPRVYLLMGQRFIVDSLALHRLTHDRVRERMLPNLLDVPFVLGADAAAELLAPEVAENREYRAALHETRFLIEAYPPDFWSGNLYNAWLDALRALNRSPDRPGLPEAMRTRAWHHRLLNTQLASWAELRHDTLLYAKQSYTGGVTCEYPDAYVEPYPELYRRLRAVAGLGRSMVEDLRRERIAFDLDRVDTFFANMDRIFETLEGIAVKELAGEGLTDEEWRFLRQTIEMEMVGCGSVRWDGWYASLFFAAAEMGAPEPTIADIHTAPTDAGGNPVGWVLHAATGFPRLMVFTLHDGEDAGGKTHAYLGPVSTFYSLRTDGFERRTDSEWLDLLLGGPPPPRPAWTEIFAP